MRLGAIAFLAGIFILHTLPALPAIEWVWGLPVALLLSWRIPSLRLPVWGLTGFLWALLWVPSELQRQLPAEWEIQDVRVEGWISSIPQSFYRSTRFLLDVDTLRHKELSLPLAGKLRLSWYNDHPPLRTGDKWALTVRLKRPRGLANPGGFDYERWTYTRDIAAQGYVRETPAPRLLEVATRYPVDRFRQQVVERIQRLLPDNPYSGILIALAVGERQGIQDRQWEIFSLTGTAHLMAISGLHVGLVAGLVFILFRHGWTRIPLLTHCWPAAKAAALAALLGAASYALLAGLSLPTQRALIMIAVAMLALLSQRPVVSSRILALALLAVLIFDPMAPLEGGFWLSFAAVAAILYGVVGRQNADNPTAKQWLRLQFIIFLALLPVTLMLFQQIALLSPVANLIAIPWVSVTVVPLTLAAVLAGLVSEYWQAIFLELAAMAMDWLWHFLRWLGNLPLARLAYPAPPLWTLIFALPGLMLWLSPIGLPGRWLGGVLCLPLFFFLRPAPLPGTIWFTLLDVGQGLAAVVRTADHVLVYDTGPRRGIGFDAGRSVLVPFLRQQGIGRIDTLVISHRDNAHMGGTRSLLEQIASDRVLTSSPHEVPIEGAESCRAGMEWFWDGVYMRILHPPEDFRSADDNASCVLSIQGQGGRLLLTGDIEDSAQQALLATYGDDLAAEVLVAPHHGHRPLSKPAFLAAVRPRYVLFSTGYKNRFGYPRPETVTGYGRDGAVVLDTVKLGAITLRLQDGDWHPEFYRQQVRRYWHHSKVDNIRFFKFSGS